MLVAIDKTGQRAGHDPATIESLGSARRILTSELSPEDARAEILRKHARARPTPWTGIGPPTESDHVLNRLQCTSPTK
jgi:hypothetical protein